jgi:hypothetical protein
MITPANSSRRDAANVMQGSGPSPDLAFKSLPRELECINQAAFRCDINLLIER